jgi:hypothetical protein
MLGWDWCGFHKKHIGTSYVELVILQLEGYAGHVMHFGASGARNVDALFFKLMWDPYGFHKKRAETHYAELLFCIRLDLWVTQCIAVRPGHETSTHCFLAQVGPVRIPEKARRDMLRQTCVFTHMVGYEGHVVHSGAPGVRNINTLFFMLMWGSV